MSNTVIPSGAAELAIFYDNNTNSSLDNSAMLLVDDEISLLSSFAINVASIELSCTIAHIIPFAVTDKPIVLVFYPSY